MMSRDKKTAEEISVAEPAAAGQKLEALGRDVISAMQLVRELLSARATALEDCQSALEEEFQKVSQEEQTCVSLEVELRQQFEQREAQLNEREKQAHELSQKCEAQTRGLQAREAVLSEQQHAFETRKAEVTAELEKIDCNRRRNPKENFYPLIVISGTSCNIE